MRVIGMMRYTFKVLSVFFWGYCGIALAELNTFYPGDKINSSEMNDNFQYLEDKIQILESQINGSGSGSDLSACSASDLAGRWIGVTADADIGYRSFFMLIDDAGNIEADVATNNGTVSATGSISIRPSCTLSSFTASSAAAGITNYGGGYGALSKSGNTMVTTVEDNYGYSFAFTAVKIP